MNSNIYMSNQNNILMKSMTKEEILIKSLIEEIQDAEKKISEINNNENKEEDDDEEEEEEEEDDDSNEDEGKEKKD